MIKIDIKKYAQLAHQRAVDKGFYENQRSNTEIIWLIITEFAEATNAHRKSENADLQYFFNLMDCGGNFVSLYKEYIKDTFQAEIAGAFIRLLDFIGYLGFGNFDKAYQLQIFEYNDICELFSKVTKNLMNNALPHIYSSTFALSALASIAQKEGFDLMQFVDLEMKYNLTRPHKNGAKY